MAKTSVAGDGARAPWLSELQKRQITVVGDGNRQVVVTGAGVGSRTPGTLNNAVANPFTVILSDPNLLNCCICRAPLTIPVYQCLNGHMACSRCFFKLNLKCPSCPNQTARGTTRNLGIETVLQSMKISCSNEIYGCHEKFSYCNKNEHEKTCVYAKYPCPFTTCTFSGSPKELYLHLKNQHTNSVVLISFGNDYEFSVSKDYRFVIFLGEGDDDDDNGAIIVLYLKASKMRIGCIQLSNPSKGRRGFRYSLFVGDKCASSCFKSFAYSLRSDYLAREKATEESGVRLHSANFVTVFDYLFPSRESVCVDLRVCKLDCICTYCRACGRRRC